jgi:hypothetical protein
LSDGCKSNGRERLRERKVFGEDENVQVFVFAAGF